MESALQEGLSRATVTGGNKRDRAAAVGEDASDAPAQKKRKVAAGLGMYGLDALDSDSSGSESEAES